MDVEEYARRKTTIDVEGRAFLGVKIYKIFREIRQRSKYPMLSRHSSHAGCLLQNSKKNEEEYDFVIVAKNIKSIICIESKIVSMENL